MFFLDKNNNYHFDHRKLGAAHKDCFNKIETALANDQVAIVSNTFVDTKSVRKYRRLGERYNAEITIYRCTGNFKNVHDVPDEVIEDMRKNFEDVDNEIILE